MKKSAFLTFCFALIPGCGQMYQGYMKRGISLMFWFFVPIALASIFWMEALLFLLPVIWAYSFFDTFNLRNLSQEQRAALGDFFLPNAAWLQEQKADKWLKDVKLGRVAGWLCIIGGVWALFGMFWDYFYYLAWEFSPMLAEWIGRLPALLIAAVVIVLGVRLLRGSRAPQEDVPPPPIQEDNEDA